MLMKPMETAAAEAVSVSVGRAQKGGGQKYAVKPVRHSHVITTANGWPVNCAARQKERRGRLSKHAMPFAVARPVRGEPEMKTPASPQG